MNNMKNKAVITAVIIFSILSVVTIGYAAATNQISFNGHAALNPILNIGMTSPAIESMRSGESVSTATAVNENDTLIFSIVLISPGDSRKIGFKISNKGNQPAKLGKFVNLDPVNNPAIDITWPNIEGKVIMPGTVSEVYYITIAWDPDYYDATSGTNFFTVTIGYGLG